MERLLYISRKNENDAKASYNRSNLYRDLFSHDLNNILQSFQGYLDLSSLYIRNPNKIEKIKDLLNLANRQICRASNLVSSVNILSKLETIKQEQQDTNFFMILKQAIKNIKEAAAKYKDLDIQIDILTQKKYIKSNELLIYIFENLLKNSIIHNKNSQITILIKVSEENIETLNYIKFEFIDNGIGIPDSQKDKIFMRGSEESDLTSGIGLGLTMVNKMIEIYNGKIYVEDKIKGDHTKGSNFIIEIPASN